MNILVSGSTGLVGSSLLVYLSSKGHSLKALVRHAPTHPSQIRWDPPEQAPDPTSLENLDAVIHLAGESIASGRWTEARKRAIRDSRVLGTRVLAEALARTQKPPKVFISASAIGYYGDCGSEVLTENSLAGQGFLAEVCKAWEAASAPVSQKNVRTVHLRFGIILSAQGGALGKMLFPFKMGVGGILGSGSQYMSWIALDDVLGAIAFALGTPSLQGPVNVVSPNPVTNSQFTKTLGRVLARPTVLPMPAFAARLAFGEMANALLLSSQRVEPAVLSQAGYHFQWTDLEGTFRHLLRSV